MKNNDQKEKIFEEYYKYIGSIHAENTAKEADDIIEKARDIDYPEELDCWFEGNINDFIKEEKQNKFKNRFSSIAKRAAIFLIILGLGAFVTTMSVEAYRIRFFNLITEVTEKYTNFSIERESDESNNEDVVLGKSYFYPGYIPAGYKRSDAQNHGELRIVYFENTEGNRIEFLQTELDSNFQVDTEDATTEDININGSEGILVSKEGVKTLLWFTDTNSFSIMGKLNREEIVSIAESIEFIK